MSESGSYYVIVSIRDTVAWVLLHNYVHNNHNCNHNPNTNLNHNLNAVAK